MAKGNPIEPIKESRVGSFTAAAKSHSEGIQEYASHVLANPNASPTMKRKANFAKNAAKWHH